MKIRKSSVVIIALTSTLLLGACGQNKITEEAKKVKEENKISKKESKTQQEKSTKKMEKYYKKYEKPVEESIKAAGIDKVVVISEKNNFQQLEDYKDPVEFAKYAGKVLFGYYTLQISPEQYYQFLIHYGSKSLAESLPSQEDSIKVFSNLQNMFKEKNTDGTEYELTVPVLDRLKGEGHFYRKTTTIQGVEYFQTTITKENGVWKFVEDGPAPPYDVIDQSNTTTSK